jgi:N-acyl-L-homoserine lactone synthetase
MTMLRYVYAADLAAHPRLQDSMFRDRATQFSQRMRWDVTVDARGWEQDEYDALNPLYVIWERADGTHGGSARFLPTTGRTMVNDHFPHLSQGVAFRSPFIWECTRFCLSPQADARVAPALMLGGGEVMRGFGVDHFVGVFDQVMLRVYRGIGAVPDVLGTDRSAGRGLSVGLWTYDPAARARLLQRAGVSSDLSDHWFHRGFGRPVDLRLSA